MSDLPPPPPEFEPGSSSQPPPPPPDPSAQPPHYTDADGTSQSPALPAKESNGLGIAGFVIAIVGVLLCWIPIFGLIVAIVATVFSAIGFRAATKSGAPHKGLSIAGLVLGILELLAAIFITVFVLIAVDTVIDCTSHFDDYLDAPAGSEAEEQAYSRWLECTSDI